METCRDENIVHIKQKSCLSPVFRRMVGTGYDNIMNCFLLVSILLGEGWGGLGLLSWLHFLWSSVYTWGGGGGVLSYSLGGGVPLGSQKSYPLLKSISQIL